jgi:hypothetical protein
VLQVARAASRRSRFALKRLGLAAMLGALVFGGVYGLAASLNVSTQTLGAGNTAVAACQSGTLTASYTTAYDSTAGGYEVTAVNVSGLDTTSSPNCASKAYKITLTGSGNTSLLESTGTTPASGTTFSTASLAASNVLATSVTGLHVTIAG